VIQRPQSLYLLFAALCNLAAFWNPIYGRAMADPATWISYGFAIILTLAMLISIVSIFLFKDRSLQLKIVKLGTYFQIAGLGFAISILFSMGGFGTYLWRESLGVLLIFISLGFYWLSGKGIKSDQELVKSMDRIR
tara:strand:+ start:12069 stop:12476 length:408 start_codon:yes stop_codon:yes gene_type:complete